MITFDASRNLAALDALSRIHPSAAQDNRAMPAQYARLLRDAQVALQFYPETSALVRQLWEDRVAKKQGLAGIKYWASEIGRRFSQHFPSGTYRIGELVDLTFQEPAPLPWVVAHQAGRYFQPAQGDAALTLGGLFSFQEGGWGMVSWDERNHRSDKYCFWPMTMRIQGRTSPLHPMPPLEPPDPRDNIDGFQEAGVTVSPNRLESWVETNNKSGTHLYAARIHYDTTQRRRDQCGLEVHLNGKELNLYRFYLSDVDLTTLTPTLDVRLPQFCFTPGAFWEIQSTTALDAFLLGPNMIYSGVDYEVFVGLEILAGRERGFDIAVCDTRHEDLNPYVQYRHLESQWMTFKKPVEITVNYLGLNRFGLPRYWGYHAALPWEDQSGVTIESIRLKDLPPDQLASRARYILARSGYPLSITGTP